MTTYAVNRATREHRIAKPGAAWRSPWQLLSADEDGWIEWFGGECPLPDGAPYEERDRLGQISKLSHPEMNEKHWEHRSGDDDTLAYRPILDTKPEAPAWDGEGLPPVGARIQAKDDYSQWQECRVASVEGNQLWLDYDDDGYATHDARDIDIRPLTTPVQREENYTAENFRLALSGYEGAMRVDCEALALHMVRAIRDGKVPGVKLEGAS